MSPLLDVIAAPLTSMVQPWSGPVGFGVQLRLQSSGVWSLQLGSGSPAQIRLVGSGPVGHRVGFGGVWDQQGLGPEKSWSAATWGPKGPGVR